MKLDITVIGILRGVDPVFFRSVMDASFASCLQAIEVTMNTEGALQMVSANGTSVPPGRLLGMGTIRNLDEAKKAVEAGAMFLVTPNTDTKEIARYQAIKKLNSLFLEIPDSLGYTLNQEEVFIHEEKSRHCIR